MTDLAFPEGAPDRPPLGTDEPETVTVDPPQVDPLRCPECSAGPFKNVAGLRGHAMKHAKERRRASLPPSITLNLSPGKSKGKDAELDAVEERAKQLVQFLAAGVILIEKAPNGPLDAVDLNAGAEQWAKAVRELAVHEDWLRKLAAGGEASARAMAWITFVLSTGGMLLPIFHRHGLIPEAVIQAKGAMEAAMTDGTPTPAAA